MDVVEMIAAARSAAENAHAPYSKFRVGAVAVGADGETFAGANVENAAYPSGSCAEAAAINAAVSNGVGTIAAVAVACVDATDIEGAYPCGRCRQIMSEFDVPRIIVTAGEGSEVREHTIDELLPHRFKL
jgi:cytidine deaminase